jgi:hypothetical protein
MAKKKITTEAEALALVKEGGYKLEGVPENLKTEKVCLAAVQNFGNALKHVPEALKTPEICLAAVHNKGEALEYVPEKLKTAELCLAAVQAVQGGMALEYVPEALKTPELCLSAVQDEGEALEYVPEKLKTAELCLDAVQDDIWALHYVPEAMKTPGFYLAAVKLNYKALKYVPGESKTAELCLAAADCYADIINRKKIFVTIEDDESLLFQVPKELKSKIKERLKEKLGRNVGYDEDEDSEDYDEDEDSEDYDEDTMRIETMDDLIEKGLYYMPEEIPDRYHIDELYIAELCSDNIDFEGLPRHLQVPEIQALYKEFSKWYGKTGSDKEVCWEEYGHKFLEVLKSMRGNTAKSKFTIQIYVNGTEEDIAALWKAWPQPDEIVKGGTYKNKVSSKGITLSVKPKGELAEGMLFALPKKEKAIDYFFDDLFAEYPQLSFFISVISKDKKEFDYWIGANGKLHESIQDDYQGDTLEFIEDKKTELTDYFPYIPATLKTPELCLEKVQEKESNIEYVPKAMREEIAKQAGIDYEDSEDYEDTKKPAKKTAVKKTEKKPVVKKQAKKKPAAKKPAAKKKK